MQTSIYCVLAGSQSAEPVLARVTASSAGHAMGGAGKTDLHDANTAQGDVLKSIQDAEQLLFELLEGVNVSRVAGAWLGRRGVARFAGSACVMVMLLALAVIVPGLLALLGVSVDTSGLAGWPELARAVATVALSLLSLACLVTFLAAQRSVRQCRALAKDLRSQKRSIALADPQTGCMDDVLYSGNSGGLSFLLALMLAVLKPQQISAWFPWLHVLMNRQADVVCTATVNPNGKIGRVGEIDVKLGAIRPDADTFWILSSENSNDVQDYYRESINGLSADPRWPVRGNYQFYRSQDKRHAFLFIRHISDLDGFFSAPHAQSVRRTIIVGVLCSCAAMLGAWLLPGFSAPEFAISQCGMGTQTASFNEAATPGVWEADQSIVECIVTLKPNGYPGPLDIEVQSSEDSLLSGDATMDLANERRHIIRRLSGAQHYSFFVRKASAVAAPAYVIVGVVVRNMAGRQASAAVVLPLH
jgi:hypothetical protein